MTHNLSPLKQKIQEAVLEKMKLPPTKKEMLEALDTMAKQFPAKGEVIKMKKIIF